MYEEDLALNNLRWLIFHNTQGYYSCMYLIVNSSKDIVIEALFYLFIFLFENFVEKMVCATT